MVFKFCQYLFDYGFDGDGIFIFVVNQVVVGSNCGWMWKIVDDDWDICNEVYWIQLLDNGLVEFNKFYYECFNYYLQFFIFICSCFQL